MPKGEHFRKYPSKEKLDTQFNIRINSTLLEMLREKVGNPQEWIRTQIREFLSRQPPKQSSDKNDFVRTIRHILALNFSYNTYLQEKDKPMAAIQQEWDAAMLQMAEKLQQLRQITSIGVLKATLRLLLDEPIRRINETLDEAIENAKKLKNLLGESAFYDSFAEDDKPHSEEAF